MPTAHRIATLRDDLVFVILLYQRHIYPVDKSRTNEFGRAYAEAPLLVEARGDGEAALNEHACGEDEGKTAPTGGAADCESSKTKAE